MNHNASEVRHQKFEHFKKMSQLVMKTFILGMLGPLGPLMLGCGYASITDPSSGQKAEIHDHIEGHVGEKMVCLIYEDPVPYKLEKHGAITHWLEEGQTIEGISGKGGRKAVHRHPKIANILDYTGPFSGAHEYQLE